MVNNMVLTDLVSATIEKNSDGTYKHTYYFDTEDGCTYKVTFPKVGKMSLSLESESETDYFYWGQNISRKFFFTKDETEIYKDGDNNVMYIEDITDYHTMSLRDIEKELGYKIKITE